jgi:AraC family transcriptional regulator
VREEPLYLVGSCRLPIASERMPSSADAKAFEEDRMQTMSALPINPRYAALGVENAVLSGTSSRHSAIDCEGWLSIKGMLGGSAVWESGSRRWTVNEDCCLILNDRQAYTLTIESAQPATTFCVFFSRGFVEDIYHASVTPAADLLDDPRAGRCEFHQGLEPRSSPISAAVRRLHAAIEGMTREDWDNRFLELAKSMIQERHHASERAAKLPAARQSTREELYRRVLRGRDHLLSSSGERVLLSEIARQACLSPFHFHRSFTRIFGATPHQYLTAYRMERAMGLLRQRSVTDVALESGFDSPASFTNLFRRHFGYPPTKVRSRIARVQGGELA